MAKYSKRTALRQSEAIELIQEFFETVGTTRGVSEAAKVFKDLVSHQELIMIARRLKIAELLLMGNTYAAVQQKTHASMPTIARISGWLQTSGDGFRLLYERRKKNNKNEEKVDARSPWKSFRRRYPMYFWPQLLLEDVMKYLSKKKREEMRGILNELKQKADLQSKYSHV